MYQHLRLQQLFALQFCECCGAPNPSHRQRNTETGAANTDRAAGVYYTTVPRAYTRTADSNLSCQLVKLQNDLATNKPTETR